MSPSSDYYEDLEAAYWRDAIAKHGRVSGQEVAELLRRAMSGQVSATSDRPGVTWDAVYIGHFSIRADGHLVVIFDDADVVDYVDCVEWADGRVGHFDDWYERNETPLDLLSDAEREAFDKWIRSVK
jgi:hypothetical protein